MKSPKAPYSTVLTTTQGDSKPDGWSQAAFRHLRESLVLRPEHKLHPDLTLHSIRIRNSDTPGHQGLKSGIALGMGLLITVLNPWGRRPSPTLKQGAPESLSSPGKQSLPFSGIVVWPRLRAPLGRPRMQAIFPALWAAAQTRASRHEATSGVKPPLRVIFA